MPALTEPQKMFIVQALARFQTPSEVVAGVKEELGLDIPKQQAEAYDPTKHQGRQLSKKWREVFAATRKAYLENVADVPLAHRGYRLQQLQDLYDKARKAGKTGNIPLARDILIEAEKIIGDMYSNRQRPDPPDADEISRRVRTAVRAMCAADGLDNAA